MVARRPKVAFVHEFLTQYGGAERVLEALLEQYPDAPLYTLIYDPEKMGKAFAGRDIRTSPLQQFPLSRSKFKWYLPLMAWATEQLRLPTDLDLVISDSSAFAKGVIAPQGVPHLCYLHTPTRYLWSSRDEYVRDAPIPGIVRPFVGPVLNYLKRWDYLAGQRPDVYIANSKNVAQRLERYYDRQADHILFPFVDLERFRPSDTIGDYVFVLSRLEPYKRADLVLDACRELGWPLKVAGGGSMLGEYKRRYADAPHIEFLGRVDDAQLPELYARARVFVFPPEEDAGMTPLEAMASGRPVLAYGRGGALESIKPGLSGEFFDEQTVESVKKALTSYDWTRYTAASIRTHVAQFDVKPFVAKFDTIVRSTITEGSTRHGS